jgi:hypothetical protein
MTHFLLTGANGFVGRALGDALIREGHSVTGLVRRSSSNAAGVAEWIDGVSDFNGFVSRFAIGLGTDCVIYLAARVHVMRDGARDPVAGYRATNVSGNASRFATTSPEVGGQILYVSDGHDLMVAELIRRLGVHVQRPARLVPVPVSMLRTVGLLTGRAAQVRRDIAPLRGDMSVIQARFEWHPPFSIDEGLTAPAHWYRTVNSVALLIAINPAPVSWWALGIVGFLMVWLVKLYNFMDGDEGLAGGIALFGFGAYPVAALSGPPPQPDLGDAATAIATSAAGFLIFNRYTARTFLADAGSVPLGLSAGALGDWRWLKGTWPVWFPALTFAPFIADASVTLPRRLSFGEVIWRSHRERYCQRMVQLGLAHAGTAWIWYLLMLSGVILAIVALRFPPAWQRAVSTGWAIVIVFAGVVIDTLWRRHKSRLSELVRGPRG